MKQLLFTWRKHRFGLIVLLASLLISISFLTRLVLFLKSFAETELTINNVAGIFLLGFFFDLVNAIYFIIPFALYLWLMPQKIYQKKWHSYFLTALLFLFTSILIFNAAAEYFFWDEFQTRFNFIAVDYLVYTTEVLGNIRQSFPVEWIISGIIFIALLITYFLRHTINKTAEQPVRLKTRSALLTAYGGVVFLVFGLTDNTFHHFSSNTYVNELAGNGMYELFAAYRNNELDYDKFYPHLNETQANNDFKKIMETPESAFLPSKTFALNRKITHRGTEKKLNVVLISVESLSAEFMQHFGGTKNITPFLDSLASESLLFTHLYATGTRTVRGLEALSLSIPPTPGQSIVRRPHNENLFSLASVFNEKGYESKFIYGGYSYFDNMGYFFENNHYKVIDRSALDDNEIAYENIWGVADENLFTLSMREIEKTISNNKPAFAHIMTTSNHRPFTYPEGRIDIPPHTGRAGAVKYTDYAIGKFIRDASKKPWFANTVFIITADHCASSAGKTDLPLSKYRIPMLIFSPQNISARVQDRLMSQIDIAPTLLGLLNFSYETKFFGYDIAALPKGKERAFISTYQLLGYIKNDSLVMLAPNKAPEVFAIGKDHESVSKIPASGHIAREAITWYQEASYAFKHGLMN